MGLASTLRSWSFWSMLAAAVGCGGGDGGSTGGAAGVSGVGTAGVLAGQVGVAGSSAGAGSAGTLGTAGTMSAAGSGSGDPGTMSERAACRIYARATCERRNECSGIPEEANPCAELQDECPDLVFSPGSTRTVASVLACAAEFAAYPCEDVRASKVPPCVTAGTRKGGESCTYANQCESLLCVGGVPNPDSPMCGQCARLVGPSEACGAADVACPVNERCELGQCVPVPQNMAMLPGPVALGEPCWGSECAPGTVCLVDPAVVSGSPTFCQVMPGLGEVCGRDPGTTSDSPFGRRCVDGAYCDASNHCTAYPSTGATCGIVFGTFPPGGAPVACDSETAVCVSDVCVANAARGEPCGAAASTASRSGNCVQDLDCLGSPAECQALTCNASNVCALVVAEGKACTEPFTVCETGTACEAGSCKATGLRGTFQTACGP